MTFSTHKLKRETGTPPTARTDPVISTPEVTLGTSPRRSLLEVCTDLFTKLENSLVKNRTSFIEDYFVTQAKRDEMESLWIDPVYCQHLKTVVQTEVMPLYDQYCAVRQRIWDRAAKRQESRAWVKYCVWTIVACEVVEAIFSRGRSLRPQILFPTAALEGLLGLGLYYLVNLGDRITLNSARRRLLNSIRELDTRCEVAHRYALYRQYSGGALINAELQESLAAYASPDAFWKDYYAARKADPTSEKELQMLDLPGLRSFLEPHTRGGYSPQARLERFNELFLLAHKTFVTNDREGYVLNHLSAVQKT